MADAPLEELCAALPADSVHSFIRALRESKSQLSIDKLAQLLLRRVNGLQLEMTKTNDNVFAGIIIVFLITIFFFFFGFSSMSV